MIVLSNEQYNQASRDVVVVAMTSNPTTTPYSLIITSADLVQGALNRPGTVRVDKIYTLEQTLIVRTFGRIGEPILDRIRTVLQTLINTGSS